MKWSSNAWALPLLTLIACGGEGSQSSDVPGSGGGSGGMEQLDGAGDAGQGADGGMKAMAGSAAGGRGPNAGSGTGGSAGTDTGGDGSNNAGSGGEAGRAGAAGQGGMVTTPEALVPIAKSFCAAAESCCTKEQMPSQLDDCESNYASHSDTAKALARGTVTLDSAGLGRCLAAYQAAAESCEQLSVLSACRGIVHGTRAEGESCVTGSECAGDEGKAKGKACLLPDSDPGSVGVCKKIPHGNVGDACDITCRPDEECTWTSYGAVDQPPAICFEAEGVYCDIYSDTPQCRAIHATGTDCTASEQCGSAAHCDIDTRTCKKLGQLNDPCGTCIPELSCIDGECKSRSFTAGSTCDGYSLGP